MSNRLQYLGGLSRHILINIGGRTACPLVRLLESTKSASRTLNPQNRHLNVHRRLKFAFSTPFGPVCGRIRFVAEPASGRLRKFGQEAIHLARKMKSQHVHVHVVNMFYQYFYSTGDVCIGNTDSPQCSSIFQMQPGWATNYWQFPLTPSMQESI